MQQSQSIINGREERRSEHSNAVINNGLVGFNQYNTWTLISDRNTNIGMHPPTYTQKLPVRRQKHMHTHDKHRISRQPSISMPLQGTDFPLGFRRDTATLNLSLTAHGFVYLCL